MRAFLVGTAAYVVIPSVMVFCTLILPARIDRIVNIALSTLYAVTIVMGAIGEWGYYILGSVTEAALLAAMVYYAWTWPRRPPRSG